MVKLLNTPFGQYGYVLNRDPVFDQLLPDLATNAPAENRCLGNRPSAYDAKYLRTTDLSKGSKVFRINDQRSYMKHGLLHKGQAPFVFLDHDMARSKLTNISNTSSAKPSQQTERGQTKYGVRLPPSVKENCKVATKESQHAGKSTLAQQHRGFANSYAASRSDLGSLASRLGSGNEDSFKLKDKCWNGDSDKKMEMMNSKSELILLDPSEMPLSQLSKLKNRRLHDVYTNMYQKHDKTRRKLIAERIRTAEKIKENLHHAELEEQRNMLRTSTTSQRNQLKELRERHAKSFYNRLDSLYTSKLHQNRNDLTVESSSTHDLLKESVSRLSLPRKVYGLPEDLNEPRPDTVPSKPIYQFPPGKLSLDSYLRTRNNLPRKFNNVWNKTSPISTPRKSEANQ